MSFDKKSVGELKELLKKAGMVQSGDKGTLVWRLNIHKKCIEKGLHVGGVNPCEMKMKDLTKACAQSGVSPIGNQDELLDALVKHLEVTKPSTTSSSQSSSSSQSAGGGVSDPIAIARRVLELDELDDWEGILNLAAPNPESKVNKNSPIAIMRKLYLKLSLVVHPDKIGRDFDQATKSFQAIVRALDRLSSPDQNDDEEVEVGGGSGRGGGNRQSAKQSVSKIARSNENCFRTRVSCPRCKQPWSEGGLDGNPDYFYNHLMMGLKCFTCSTCLCEFGCITAIHQCPHCRKSFEYSPQDYHRQITCGRSSCTKKFGFFMYNCSDRVLSELKIELKKEQEYRAKIREEKRRRAQRLKRGTGDVDNEAAFILGLVDCCPRCGDMLEEFSDEEARRHLMDCSDTTKHKAHAAKVMEKKKQEEAKAAKAAKQEAAQDMATWQFLGAKTSQLWLLDDEQLRLQAKESNISDVDGDDRDTLISKIVEARRDNDADVGGGRGRGSGSGGGKRTLMITDSKESSSRSGRGGDKKSPLKRQRLSIESLPSNLHSLDVSQLRSICASHGLLKLLPKNATKSEILDIIEDEVYAHAEGRESNKLLLNAAPTMESSPIDISDSDEEYHDD